MAQNGVTSLHYSLERSLSVIYVSIFIEIAFFILGHHILADRMLAGSKIVS